MVNLGDYHLDVSSVRHLLLLGTPSLLRTLLLAQAIYKEPCLAGYGSQIT